MHVDFNQPFFCARARIEVFTKPSSISGNTVMMSILIKSFTLFWCKNTILTMCREIFSWLFSVATNAQQAVFAHLGWGKLSGILPDAAASTLFRLCSSPNDPKRVVAVDNAKNLLCHRAVIGFKANSHTMVFFFQLTVFLAYLQS